MIEPRVYRAAFVPALFALVLVAFSLESPPRPLDQGLAADVLFEGTSAVKTVGSIVAAAPDRSAGSNGDRATARRVGDAFRKQGFSTTVDRWQEDGRTLENVVGSRAGDSSREIVVLAERDSRAGPDATGSAADTAALIEFARVFGGRAPNKTLVLASVDGGQIGDLGAARLADRLGGTGQVEAAIVLSGLGARRQHGPLVVGWSNSTTRVGLGLQRTVEGSLRQEVAGARSQEGTLAQFARLAFPIGPGGQAVLLEQGYDAVRIAGQGEFGASGSGRLADVSADRFGALGRSVLRMISTLDGSEREPARGAHSYLTVGGMVLPAWVLRLLALTLVLPALVASIDALARARRRREQVGVWFAWLGTGALAFVLAIAVAWLLSIVGLTRDAPPAPLDPHSVALDGKAFAALAAALVTAALVWFVLRTRGFGSGGATGDATSPGAACATSLALAVVTLGVAVLNPFAALVLVPALHLWMLATLTALRPRIGIAMAVTGLVPILAVVVYYLWRLDLSPLRGAYYLLLLVTGNQTGLLTTAVLVALLAIVTSVAAILVARTRRGDATRPARDRRPEEPRPPIFGPGGHAGPGMLGGTHSGANRR